MEVDPGRIVYLNERLDQLYSLQQKHHVTGEEDLIKLRDDFEVKVNSVFRTTNHFWYLKIPLPKRKMNCWYWPTS